MTPARSAGLHGMDDRMQRLQPLVGEWRLETSLGPKDGVRARTVFEWSLDGAVLVQRSEIDVPEAPDLFAVIAADPATDGYTQHYFDSRGVVRLYAMTFDGRVWTLTREQPDFTPLEFAQRYTGELSADGSRITGRWEIRHPGLDWAPDFELGYVRDVVSS